MLYIKWRRKTEKEESEGREEKNGGGEWRIISTKPTSSALQICRGV